MTQDTDETFIRTSPPLNRFVVKLGGPAPWDVLTAERARELADDIHGAVTGYVLSPGWLADVGLLSVYAAAVDAMSKKE